MTRRITKTSASAHDTANRCESLARAFEVEELRVTIASGRLVIEGCVPSYTIKQQAGQAAARLFASKNVVNLMRVVPQRRRSDSELRQAVQATLARCRPLARARLEVSARAGVVSLRGRVPSRAARCEVERQVWAVAGITNIHNGLRVSRVA